MNNFTEDLTGLSRSDLVYKAKLDARGAYELEADREAEDYHTLHDNWFRSLRDAVVLAFGIIATWTHPIYHVRSEYNLSRAHKKRVRDYMTMRVKEWAQAHGLLHWHATTQGTGLLAETARKWAIQHAPTQLEIDDWDRRLTRLDYTLALGFVLKCTQQKHTEVSFVSQLNRDMREHLNTFCDHTTYAAWNDAIARKRDEDQRLIDAGGYPLARTKPLDDTVARTGDGIICQAAYKKLMTRRWRGDRLFSFDAVLRWICGGNGDVFEHVRDKFGDSSLPGLKYEATTYIPSVHDSDYFMFSSSTVIGQVLMPNSSSSSGKRSVTSTR